MLTFFQLFLAVFAIYGAISYEEGARLLVPLACLVVMLGIGRVDKKGAEKENARKSYLKSEIDKISRKELTAFREQEYFTIETLLWPKSEMLLIDAVHFIFKDLGFKISTGINYQWVDRIVRVPNIEKAFGVQVMMSDGEADNHHPKINRALLFEKEKREKEKTLIVASTFIRTPLAERGQVSHISKGLTDLLVERNMSFITAHHLYELWHKAKNGEIDILGFFQNLYSQQGENLALKGLKGFTLPTTDFPVS